MFGHVIKYWNMAGFKTLQQKNAEKHIRVEVEKYKSINKTRSRSSELEQKKRGEYLERIKHLFDIATPDLENILQKSRLLQNNDECTRYRVEEGYTRKLEDINFLLDQRGDRKMVMDQRDPSYEQRLETSKQR